MWGNARKRKTTRIVTLIGHETQVLGDIKFSGGLHIEGTINGNVYAENDGRSMLSLSERGPTGVVVQANSLVLRSATYSCDQT